MAYKYSKGAQVIGDLKAADDAERNTLIDFGEDQIDFQTSGSVRLQITNDGVYIPDTSAAASLRVSGGIECTPGNQEGLRFLKSATELNFISFQEGTEGGSYNARMSYNSEEYLFIAPGRAADFFINSGKSSGDFTYPFSIMDDGTAKFTKGLTDASERAIDLAPDVAFYVSGTADGNNNALFVGNVVMSSSLNVEGTLSFEDVIMTELSIPGVDLQTDTNAYRFTSPYNLELLSLGLSLDTAASSGNTTINVTNPDDGTLITATISATNDFVTQNTVTSGSRSQGDSITFEITAAGTGAQGLRANLYFRRSI